MLYLPARRPQQPEPFAISAERCWSGRTGLPAKQFHPKRVTGVRIPPSPPTLFIPQISIDASQTTLPKSDLLPGGLRKNC
jgi:hypothetical protein